MASEEALWLIGWAYVLANSGRVLSYRPQIVTVWRCQDGAKAISLTTWIYWAFSHLTGVLYAWWVIGDAKLLAVSAGNLACCATAVVLTLFRCHHLRVRAQNSLLRERFTEHGAAERRPLICHGRLLWREDFYGQKQVVGKP